MGFATAEKKQQKIKFSLLLVANSKREENILNALITAICFELANIYLKLPKKALRLKW